MLARGEACDAGTGHRVRELDVAGTEALVTEVWGPPPVRTQLRRTAKAGGSGAGAGGVLEACGQGCGEGCGSLDVGGSLGEIAAVLMVILAAAVVAVVLYWAISRIVRYVRKRRNRPRPNGAPRRPARLAGHGPRGRIVAAGATLAAPLSGEACAAYGIRLDSKRFARGEVMLREAWTAGFEVELDDGTRARVPPGRVRFDAPRGARQVDDARARRHVEALAPVHGADPLENPFPFDRAYEVILREGDRVELLGQLEPRADATVEVGYREAAVVLMPTSVAALRPV